MSSAIASVRRSGFRVGEAYFAARVRTPRAKAMSVAIGMPPPLTRRSATGDSDVDERGDRHAAERRHHRQDRRPHVSEFSRDHLSLDLQTDHEEEQRHQAVVHPEVQVLVQLDDVAEPQ